ncbi:MAG TPA: pyridoxamine 5'-phosphate oxidase [Bacteroidales bacterium]|nr:pyridoxamine 5'-phosphate oxidase [Bacteroidales bacterium]
MTKKNLELLQQEISTAPFGKSIAHSNPIAQFAIWYDQAVQSGLLEPGAMTLATVAPDESPSARIVLLKAFDDRGFVFYTNYNSAKARHLAVNPNVSLIFLWLELQRQVRIEGRTEKVTGSESDEYFSTRPRASQIGAWASPQSQEIPGRQNLDDRYLAMEKEFQGKEIPRPEFWGGYRVIPETIEFWQGREGRLHDRLIYRKYEGQWTINRLAP